MVKMWLCVVGLAVVGSSPRARSGEAPAKPDARAVAASAWAGYAPARPWEAHRPESSWRGYAPQGGWKVAPAPAPLARREGGVGRDLVTVERPPLAAGR